VPWWLLLERFWQITYERAALLRFCSVYVRESRMADRRVAAEIALPRATANMLQALRKQI